MPFGLPSASWNTCSAMYISPCIPTIGI
jgi:hypothetical protein